MSTQWLAVRSFQHSQQLLEAINTLSIHVKLRQAGVPDEARTQAVGRAREMIIAFLTDFAAVLRQPSLGETRPVIGTDPRLRQLAQSFLRAKRDRRRFRSPLFRDSPEDAERLIRSDRQEDSHTLLMCLEDLRKLLEEHVDVDARRILGEI